MCDYSGLSSWETKERSLLTLNIPFTFTSPLGLEQKSLTRFEKVKLHTSEMQLEARADNQGCQCWYSWPAIVLSLICSTWLRPGPKSHCWCHQSPEGLITHRHLSFIIKQICNTCSISYCFPFLPFQDHGKKNSTRVIFPSSSS